MKVGTVCFANNRGLGYLARSFYNAGVITDAIVVHHGRMPTHLEWYKDPISITRMQQLNSLPIKRFIERMDAMLFFETPFNWNLFDYCEKFGTLSALMPMYECTPEDLPAEPDLFICPSALDMQYFPERSVFIPVPVDMPWRLRIRAETFVHNAGYIGLRERRGTREILTAMQYVQSPIQLTIRSQDTAQLNSIADSIPTVKDDKRITFGGPSESRKAVWADADVSLCAEKFNGLSLPLQEALASGMLVMASDRFPANTWLPIEPLIPVASYHKARVAGRCLEFDEAQVDPKDIAATIDKWYNQDITAYSEEGYKRAQKLSWNALKPRYIAALTQGA